MPLKTDDVAVSFAGLTSTGKIPKWAKRFNVRRTTLDELSHRESLSGIVVVQDAGSKQMEHEPDLVSLLASHVSEKLRSGKACFELSVPASRT